MLIQYINFIYTIIKYSMDVKKPLRIERSDTYKTYKNRLANYIKKYKTFKNTPHDTKYKFDFLQHNPGFSAILPDDMRYMIAQKLKEGSKKIITLSDDTIVTLLDGIPHSFDGKPAIIAEVLIDDLRAFDIIRIFNSYMYLEWYKKGILHRDNDKPAIIQYNVKNTSQEIDMLEIILQDQNFNIQRNSKPFSYPRSKKWYIDGKLQRHHNKPVIIEYTYSHNLISKIKYVLSAIQTDDNIIYDTRDGKPSSIIFSSRRNPQVNGIQARYFSDKTFIWKRNNLMHSYHDNPSFIKFDLINQEYIINWHNQDKIFRANDKPARIYKLEDDYTLSWYTMNGLSRKGDKPALISNKYYEWYDMNLLHRNNDKPAFIYRSFLNIYCLIWYKNGKFHRDGDKPALIARIGDRYLVQWYKNGNLERDDDKPAVISHINKQWWTKKGLKQTEYKSLKSSLELRNEIDRDLQKDDYKYFILIHQYTGVHPNSDQVIPSANAVFKHPVSEVSAIDLNYLNEISLNNSDLEYLNQIEFYTTTHLEQLSQKYSFSLNYDINGNPI